MADRRTGAALVGASIMALGCAARTGYRPSSSVGVTAPAAELALETIGRGGVDVSMPDEFAAPNGLTVRLRWRARAAETGISRAFLVPPEAAPCTAGIPAEAFEIDGQTRWDRPAGLGTDHRVAFAFPSDPKLQAGPLALDVVVAGAGGEECVRLPLTGAGQSYSPATSFAFGLTFSVMAPARSDAGAAVAFDFAAGRWLGPVRLTLRLGLALDANRITLGGSDSDSTSSPPKFGEVYATPELSFVPYVRGRFGVALSAGYVFGAGWQSPSAPAGAPAPPDIESDFSGPRVAVILATVTPFPLGTRPRRPASVRGFELSVFRSTVWPGQPSRGAAYILGLGYTLW